MTCRASEATWVVHYPIRRWYTVQHVLSSLFTNHASVLGTRCWRPGSPESGPIVSGNVAAWHWNCKGTPAEHTIVLIRY